MDKPPEPVPLHPLAKQILSTVVPAEPAKASAIPADKLAAITEQLRGHRSDETLFVHLIVLYHRLQGDGLFRAAEQMRELAQIGLNKADLDRALEQIDHLRQEVEQRGRQASPTPKPDRIPSTPAGVGLRPKKSPRR